MTMAAKKTAWALVIAGFGAVAIAALLRIGPQWWAAIAPHVIFFTDPENVRRLIHAAGPAGPLVFIGIQVAQVLLAPIPGELSGIIGGYLFGTGAGFIYSSIGLTLGSGLNFAIGLYLGRRWVRRLIPAPHLARFDALVQRQAAGVIFLLFVFPGFPKDYLSLFLGLSTLPLPMFLAIAAVGRMPGTLALSLQGAALLDRMYALVAAVGGFCLLAAGLAYRYRQPLYRWLARRAGSTGSQGRDRAGDC